MLPLCIPLVSSFFFFSFFLFLCRIGQENLFFEMKAYLAYAFWDRPFHGHVWILNTLSFIASAILSLSLSVFVCLCLYDVVRLVGVFLCLRMLMFEKQSEWEKEREKEEAQRHHRSTLKKMVLRQNFVAL